MSAESREIFKELRGIGRRLLSLAARAVLSRVDDSQERQSVLVTSAHSDAADKVERMQQYGYSSVPLPGADGLLVSLGGDRGHAVAICLEDPALRPRDMPAGAVVLYTHEDRPDSDHRIELLPGKVIRITAGAETVLELTPAGVTLTTPSLDIIETGN